MPFVTVVIPTYNRLALLKEAVDSVLQQTYGDYELIVVDDGSTDGTAEHILRNYPSVHLLRNEVNRGVSAARNRGIQTASGKLLAFLDSDDLWLPTKLERQVEFFMSHPEIAVCQTDEIWVRNGIRINPGRRHQKHSGWIFRECIPLCIVSPSAVMLRREVFSTVGLFDERLAACEDYDMWLRVSLHYQIISLDEKLVVKRGGRSDQLSSQWGLDRFRVAALLKILHSGMLDVSRQQLVRMEIQRRSLILEKGFAKRGKLAQAQYYRRIREGLEHVFQK